MFSSKRMSRLKLTAHRTHILKKRETQLKQTQKHLNRTSTRRTAESSVMHLFSTWATETAVAARHQCNAWIHRRHKTHFAVVDGSRHGGVRGRRRRRRVALLHLTSVDVRCGIIVRTVVVGHVTHVVGVRQDAVADSLQKLQTCVAVGVSN